MASRKLSIKRYVVTMVTLMMMIMDFDVLMEMVDSFWLDFSSLIIFPGKENFLSLATELVGTTKKFNGLLLSGINV